MNTLSGFARIVILVSTLGLVTGCSSVNQPNSRQPFESNAKSSEVRVHLDFNLTNFTGTSLRSVYLSPNTSTGWEENILGDSELKDGDTLNIRFNPNEREMTWDMRIEGIDGHYAEWKELKLGDISEITLILKLSPQPVVMAELE